MCEPAFIKFRIYHGTLGCHSRVLNKYFSLACMSVFVTPCIFARQRLGRYIPVVRNTFRIIEGGVHLIFKESLCVCVSQ
jgi:hypothetical protein